MSKRLAIYTALTGGYDTLRQPESVRKDADYFCFSNDIPEEHVGVWQIRPITFSGSNPVLASRFPKLNPHLVLPEYDVSLYADANLTLAPELDEAIDRSLAGESPCAMVPHPNRTGTFEEGLFVLRHSMGNPFRVYRQMLKLARSGFRDDAGLFVCSLIFRRHLDPCVIAFSEGWWRRFLAGAKRDQLSVMPALEEAGLHPSILIPSDYILRNTMPHTTRNKHSFVWHGWHFAARLVLTPFATKWIARKSKCLRKSMGSIGL